MLRKKFMIIPVIIVFFMTTVLMTTVLMFSNKTAYAQDDESINDQSSGLETIAVVSAGIKDIKAKSWLLMDSHTGSILLESNIDEKLPIASVTKIMTMLLVMEAIDDNRASFEDVISVSDDAISMGGSQVYLKQGEKFTLLELLKAIAIHSANDASVALADNISGDEEAFVTLMNNKAAELRMINTHFLDCTGLNDDGYSSAKDVAIMSRELIEKHPKVLDYTSIWQDTFRNGSFSLVNRNKLVRFYEGTNGLKTGFTNRAGNCLSLTAKKNNLQLISVVLGEADSETRFNDARKLLDYGFANYEIAKVGKKGEPAGSIPVKKGIEKSVESQLKDEAQLLVKKGGSEITKEINLVEFLEAPVVTGTSAGNAIYFKDGKEIARIEIVTASEVKKASFFKLMIRMILEWFGLGRK